MKLVKACIAMAAFAALFVVPSLASAAPELTHPTGTRAPIGTKILATNVAHASTIKNTVMVTPIGTLECATATITGELVKNDGTHVVGTISTVEFRGTPKAGGTHENTAHCTAPGGLGTVTATPNHTANPVHKTVASLPWCVTSSGIKDEFEVFGEVEGSCTNGKRRAITFTLHTLVGACSYEKAVVVGTYTTHPADAVLTIKDQNFVQTTGSGFCPASGKLTMAFTLATDEKEVSGTALYIS